jgi:hypothetical protein
MRWAARAGGVLRARRERRADRRARVAPAGRRRSRECARRLRRCAAMRAAAWVLMIALGALGCASKRRPSPAIGDPALPATATTRTPAPASTALQALLAALRRGSFDRATRPGSSAPTPATRARAPRTSCTAATWPKGQTGLSIAFDLPTQCGYDADHPMARPEVGKVGVPVNSLDDFHVLFDGLPLAQMNTSMTINGTAAWLLALYVALARERGEDEKRCAAPRRTTSSRSTWRAARTSSRPTPVAAHHRRDVRVLPRAEVPEWNASNICSYHLQEAGATPVQELAFALANALGVLDLLRARGTSTPPSSSSVAWAHQLLRQRRHPLHRGDVQDARVRPAVGRAHARALRHEETSA